MKKQITPIRYRECLLNRFNSTMAGLYIHIPFCKQVCRYCDFHFSVNTRRVEEMVNAICMEIKIRKDYLKSQRVNTIYLGGGTPSLLEGSLLSRITNTAAQNLCLSSSCEVTLEANPDNLNNKKLNMYKALGINRLSIGVQSFSDKVLKFLNRSHDVKTALSSIALARKAGFDNLSIDLMYAIPGQGNDVCAANVEKTLQCHPEHIATYALTIERDTVFGRWEARQKLTPTNERDSVIQFEQIAERLERAGYQHYEVSSFCKPGFHAIHNSNYWQQVPYLGVGPSAHSFDGASRQWNIRNNSLYIEGILRGKVPFQREVLSTKDRINEYILTSLRTRKGCDLNKLQEVYGIDAGQWHKDYLQTLSTRGLATLEDNRLVLTQQGKLLADTISAQLFVDDSISIIM